MKKFVSVFGIILLGLIGVVTYQYLVPTSPLLESYQLEESEFQDFIAKFHKSYSASEYNQRFAAFRENLSYYRVHNSLGKSHTLGISEYSDLTVSEFSKIYLKEMPKRPASFTTSLPLTYPASLDWRAQGKVTGIKAQGQCACGWAFSSTGVVEGSWAIAGHPLVSLSEQQLLDCSDFFGNNGCNGGYVTNSLSYALQYGFTTEGSYPYTGNPSNCNSEAVANRAATLSIYNHITQDSVPDMLAAVATSPISIDVQADSWIGYTGGVVNTPCTSTRYNYSALVVGYNTSANPPYYIVKPSFGTSFGQAGYILVAITSGPGSCCIQGQPIQSIS